MYDPIKRQSDYFTRIKVNEVLYNKHKESGRRSRKKIRNWLANYKLERGCVDCGYNLHFAALQLDHTGKKSVEIAEARTSIDRLKEEIKNGKCEVRCANCHSIKTWERKQVPK